MTTTYPANPFISNARQAGNVLRPLLTAAASALAVLALALTVALGSLRAGEVAGGRPVHEPDVVSASVPSGPQWQRWGELAYPRGLASAVLLTDGRILVVGGTAGPAPAEIFDPETGVVFATGGAVRVWPGSVVTSLPDGGALLAGGRPEDGAPASDVLRLDAQHRWTVTTAMRERRAFHAAAMLRVGTVLVAGGVSERGPLRSTERYAPDTGTWLAAGPLPEARAGATLVVLEDGRAALIGGTDERGRPTSAVFIYDPAADVWTSGSPLGSAHPDGAVGAYGGRAAVACGDGRAAEQVDIIDASGTWTAAASIEPRLRCTVIVAADGAVVVLGGLSALPGAPLMVGTAEVRSATGSMHREDIPEALARAGAQAVTTPRGTFIIGGLDAEQRPSRTIWVRH